MELELFKYGAYLATGVVGWFVGIIWNKQEKQREELSELKENLPINYVRKEEFKEVIHELKVGFKEAIIPILNKLDHIETHMGDRLRAIENTYQKKQ